MSSNEEYLDSLLKSVTSENQTDKEVDLLNNELDGEVEYAFEDKGQDREGISVDTLDQMLANVENLEIGENVLKSEVDTTNVKDEEYGIDETFIDPGALFFSSDEEEGNDDSFLAIEDIPEEFEEDASVAGNMEEELIGLADSTEEDMIALSDSEEEDLIGLADSTEEDMIALSDSEEDLIGLADSTEEDMIALSDSEEDLIGLADSTEEDVIALSDNEEDLIGLADSTEEDMIASSDNMEEDLIGLADNMEEDLFAITDNNEDASENSVLEDEGFKEISDLLASSGDEDDDMFAMLESVENEEDGIGVDIGFFDEEADSGETESEAPEESKKGRKKKEKKKKNKRNKKKELDVEENAEPENDSEEIAEKPEKKKKQGVFKRFVEFLLEEDDEEESSKVREPISEDDDLFVGEEVSENESILEELSKEDETKKSGKKKKKDKKDKKGKKGKNTEEVSESDEEGQEEEDGKAKKAKKEKKKKKEKPIIEEEPEKPGKKLSIKKIEVTVVFCLTVLAAILLAVHLIPSTLEKNKARDAYYAKDYVKVVEGFYGEELDESDSLMYNRAYTILKLQRKIDGYNNYMRMGKETEALNQLIEGVIRYKEIYPDAEKYDVTEEVDSLYQTITDALQNRYGISTTVAEGLYAMEDNFAYTLKLESIITGIEYDVPEAVEETTETIEE